MIRFADKEDIERIMGFIDTYWRKGHILGNDRDFFEYEHLLPEGVSFVISEDENKNINAILGYIPYGNKNRDLMTVMWKANHTAHASLGLELFKYLKDNGDVRIMASPGSNPKLMGLYRYLGYQFGKMKHWYRLGKHSNYEIAIVADSEIPKVAEGAPFAYLDVWEKFENSFNFINYSRDSKPYKEAWYIKKRYYDHPVFEYNIYGLLDENKKAALAVIFRVIHINGKNVIRLIDCIGDFNYIRKMSSLVDFVLAENEAEYVDCYEVGVKEEYMYEAGWKTTEGSGNVIPNYFAPFEQDNIDIYYFSNDPEIVLFKGDGDQDRPN